MVSLNFKNRSYKPIGLDIGHSCIKMIQLAENNGQISVVAADKMRIPPQENVDDKKRRDFIVSSILQMTDRTNFNGNKVISALPNEVLHITSLRLPEMDKGKIVQAVNKEAEQRFGLNLPKDSIDYLIVGNVTQGDDVKNELILFAADDKAIKDHIEMLQEARLVPVAIDPLPCALFRSFYRTLRRQEDKQQTIVFVDVGGKFTTVVFGRNGDINFIKEIPIGVEQFNSAIAGKLGITADEAEMLRATLRAERSNNTEANTSSSLQTTQSSVGLKQQLDVSTRQVIVDTVGEIAQELAKEISLCFRYYTVTFRGKRVERAIFSGGGSYDEILLNVFKRRLTVDVELAQPLRGFDMASLDFESCKRDYLCEWAVATGLSLKGLDI